MQEQILVHATDSRAILQKASVQIRPLLELWLAAKPGPDRLPRLADLSSQKLREEGILDLTWVIDRLPGGGLRYRVVGKLVVEAVGYDYSGMLFEDAHPESWEQAEVRERLETAIRNKAPSWRCGPPVTTHPSRPRMIENIVLPLAEDHKVVSGIIGLSLVHP